MEFSPEEMRNLSSIEPNADGTEPLALSPIRLLTGVGLAEEPKGYSVEDRNLRAARDIDKDWVWILLASSVLALVGVICAQMRSRTRHLRAGGVLLVCLAMAAVITTFAWAHETAQRGLDSTLLRPVSDPSIAAWAVGMLCCSLVVGGLLAVLLLLNIMRFLVVSEPKKEGSSKVNGTESNVNHRAESRRL
jgi:hypothetical protein